MLIMKCDRCGKVINNKEDISLKGEDVVVLRDVLILEKAVDPYIQKYFDIHLCLDCWKSFKITLPCRKYD